MKDSIDRQAALDIVYFECGEWLGLAKTIEKRFDELPSVEPTLYGYKIELLAYIARVMEKEGITAEQAVNSFDDLGMAVRLIIEEVQQKVEEAVMK